MTLSRHSDPITSHPNKGIAMTQHDQIIKRLRQGWTTGLQALQTCGTMKLATRVSELRRDGFTVLDKWVGEGKSRYKAYRLVK